MKRLFYVLLIFIGVLIMLKPINSIIKDSIGNIMFRGNVVTGIVATDNGNGSYDVFISESDRAYPKIFTLSRNPDLAVGDKVRILYKNGCKELPIILPPVAPSVTGYIFVYCWTAEDGYCIKSYTSNGVYVNTFSVSELQDWNNVLAVDADNNVYCVNYQLLKCYDKNGTLLYQASSDDIYSVCVDSNGYIYTNEYISEIKIVKRAAGSATIIESKTCPAQPLKLSQSFIMDSNKNIYMKKNNNDGAVKYNYPDSGDLTVVASSDSIDLYQKTLAIVDGVLAIGSRGDYEIKTAKLDLSAYISESFDFATIQEPIGISNIGNDYLCVAYDNSNDYAVLGRYKSNGTKVWETNIGTFDDTTPYQVAAYPF